MGVGGQAHAPTASTPGKDPIPILQEAGWAPGPVWKGENLVPTGIRSRTVQTVVQSLYRLSYPAHNKQQITLRKTFSSVPFVIMKHISTTRGLKAGIRGKSSSFDKKNKSVVYFISIHLTLYRQPLYEQCMGSQGQQIWKYRVIQNDCRGVNNLPYTTHLRQEYMYFFI